MWVYAYHNSSPADIEKEHYSEEHPNKLCLHPQLELFCDHRGSTLQGLAYITDPVGGGN